ncbi:MAG: ATP-binding protein [Candidatus Aminicenantes bacterium]|nr:ATP-binding protein [Candidatus Aminicenantes bacterium]
MKRAIYQKLLDWKSSGRRKPLLLKGARQTGKTYILKEFGKNEYENMFYFNFEEEAGLEDFFRRGLDPRRIIQQLSTYRKKKIMPVRDLIIFDEIQFSNNALNSLKYFREEAADYHIAAAGSLLGVKLSGPKSFPVGQVNFLEMYPLTFFEFLDALGESRYPEMLTALQELEPLPKVFHEELIDLLRKYYFVGGMPEAVQYYAGPGDLMEVRAIQDEILNSYVLDFAKHAPNTDIPKIIHIWDSLPMQLARENKKFIFSAVQKSARARDYESALQWLEDSGLILRAFAVPVGRHPLKGYMNRGSFKVYLLDIGLLGALAGIPVEIMAPGDGLFSAYRGAFVENFAAQQLVSALRVSLYYWRSEGKMAELDFLYTAAGTIYPLEVKAGINPRSKSLQSYDRQFQPPLLLRTTLLNLKRDGKTCNIPLYAISCLPLILELATAGRLRGRCVGMLEC